MPKKAILAAAAGALLAGSAQTKSRDPGPPDARMASPGEFDRIAIAGPFVVTVRTGHEIAISMSGPRTMLDDTELLVRDGQLIVRWQEGASWSRNGNHGVDIDIQVPALREAMMAGAGSIAIDRVQADDFTVKLLSAGGISVQALDVDQFKAQLAGAGSLDVGRIDAKAIEIDVAGSGEVRANGRAGTATLRLVGSGSFNNPDFAAGDASIISSGSGAVRATVTNGADIKIAGSGDVELTGGAKCSVSKQGSGNVHCG